VFCTNCTLFSFFWWARTRCIILSNWTRSWVTPSRLRRLDSTVRLRRSRRMAGWKGILYILMLVYTDGRGKGWGYYGVVQRRSSKKKACMEWKKRSGQPVSGRSSRGQLKSWTILNEKSNQKDKILAIPSSPLSTVSRKSPHLLTQRSFQKVVDMPLLSCRKWRLAMRQEGRRSNVRVPLIPVDGPYGEQSPNPGK
jgi:hypothetical protein